MALLDPQILASPADDAYPERVSVRNLGGHELLPIAVGPARALAPSGPLSAFGVRTMTAFPIQPSKVQRPALRAQTLHRTRLLDWLEARIRRRIVTVVAKAGYGKTTLLSDFAGRTGVRILWYRLDEEDRDWTTFLQYLVAAGQEADPAFAPRTASLLENATANPARDEILGAFWQELPRLGSVPTALILDDYHLVDELPEIRSIVHALVARAPDYLTLVFASRRPPSLPIARLRTLGEVAELDGDDLRFDRGETEQLFRETYNRPLDPDVLRDLQARTEGWAAPLEMVNTALRNRGPLETRIFVRQLNGAQQELYNYLAEEVVGQLEDEMQRFLMRTSLLRVVEPEVAAVAGGVTSIQALTYIESGEELCLLTRRAEGSEVSDRYHPLVAGFLEGRLRRQVGDDGVTAIHRDVARFGEGSGADWRLAAHHYAAAGDISDVHRVLATATPTIMASGDFALAHSYIERFPTPTPNPWFEIVLSRIALAEGSGDAALGHATAAVEGFGGLAAPDNDRGANQAIANLMSVEYAMGHVDRCFNLAHMLRRRHPDPDLAAISDGTVAMLETAAGGDLGAARRTLLAAAALQSERGHRHYYGITMLNLAYIDIQRGAHEEALAEATNAIASLSESSAGPELGSAMTARARALAHLGRWDQACEQLSIAVAEAHPASRTEVLAEVAEVHVLYGDCDEATQLLDVTGEGETGALGVGILLVRIRETIRRGHESNAEELLARLVQAGETTRTAGQAEILATRAEVATAFQGRASARALAEAREVSQRQQAGFWLSVVELLEACVGDPSTFCGIVTKQALRDPAYLSIVADLIARRLGDLDERALELLSAEIERRPLRWRQPIRAALHVPNEETRLQAARLLEKIGTLEDVPALRFISRVIKGKRKDPLLGRRLARRLAPKVFIEDQGPISIRIGARVVVGSEVRRKVLSLLCYLLTRPNWTATRDQVLDALWPELAPSDAINSLNQTVYFLRRVFEPEFQEDVAADYVHTDSDLLRLDPELINSRSERCRRMHRQMDKNPTPEQILELCHEYRGRFALDFSYEDWAAGYRDSLHAAYLRVAEHGIAQDTASGHFDRAIEIAQSALEAAPDADNVELALLHLYRRTGALAAAAEQYSHYASVLRKDLGIEPPPFDSL